MLHPKIRSQHQKASKVRMLSNGEVMSESSQLKKKKKKILKYANAYQYSPTFLSIPWMPPLHHPPLLEHF